VILLEQGVDLRLKSGKLVIEVALIGECFSSSAR
jgi:hypothetical protein